MDAQFPARGVAGSPKTAIRWGRCLAPGQQPPARRYGRSRHADLVCYDLVFPGRAGV